MSKQTDAIQFIAAMRAGMEQDIEALERHWPEKKRGSRADRMYQSFKTRALTAIQIAEEAQS